MITKSILNVLPSNAQNVIQVSIIKALINTNNLISVKAEYQMASSDSYDIAKDEQFIVEDILKRTGLELFKNVEKIAPELKRSISEFILDEIQALLVVEQNIDMLSDSEKNEALLRRNIVAQFNIELEKELD